MHTRTRVFVALTAAALASCATSDAPPPPNTLVVAKVASAPVLDGNANDAAWASAKPLTVKLGGGANFGGSGETTATLKAVTSAT